MLRGEDVHNLGLRVRPHQLPWDVGIIRDELNGERSVLLPHRPVRVAETLRGLFPQPLAQALECGHVPSGFQLRATLQEAAGVGCGASAQIDGVVQRVRQAFTVLAWIERPEEDALSRHRRMQDTYGEIGRLCGRLELEATSRACRRHGRRFINGMRRRAARYPGCVRDVDDPAREPA